MLFEAQLALYLMPWLLRENTFMIVHRAESVVSFPGMWA